MSTAQCAQKTWWWWPPGRKQRRQAKRPRLQSAWKSTAAISTFPFGISSTIHHVFNRFSTLDICLSCFFTFIVWVSTVKAFWESKPKFLDICTKPKHWSTSGQETVLQCGVEATWAKESAESQGLSGERLSWQARFHNYIPNRAVNWGCGDFERKAETRCHPRPVGLMKIY